MVIIHLDINILKYLPQWIFILTNTTVLLAYLDVYALLPLVHSDMRWEIPEDVSLSLGAREGITFGNKQTNERTKKWHAERPGGQGFGSHPAGRGSEGRGSGGLPLSLPSYRSIYRQSFKRPLESDGKWRARVGCASGAPSSA